MPVALLQGQDVWPSEIVGEGHVEPEGSRLKMVDDI